ncbi:MAG: hypothetical protein Q8M39_05755 [Sulfuricurvum sp.]|nr:hypothetical protein [Sulfuricurvum sp.]
MDKTTLVLVMAGLLVLFIALVFIYVWIGRSKKETAVNVEEVVTFETICSVINSTSSSNVQLNRAVATIIEHYGQISDFGAYGGLLEKLCIHPATDSKVILRFQKALIAANPKYKEQIEKALKVGLAGRDKK